MQQAIFDADTANFGEQNALADCFLEYGMTLGKAGQINAAIVNYQNALEGYRTVWNNDSKNLSAKRQVALSQRYLADAWRQKGETTRAAELFRQTTESFLELTASDPHNTEWQHDLAICYLSMGELSLTRGDAAKAAENFRRALPILEDLTAKSPADAKQQSDLKIVKNRLARFKN